LTEATEFSTVILGPLDVLTGAGLLAVEVAVLKLVSLAGGACRACGTWGGCGTSRPWVVCLGSGSCRWSGGTTCDLLAASVVSVWYQGAALLDCAEPWASFSTDIFSLSGISTFTIVVTSILPSVTLVVSHSLEHATTPVSRDTIRVRRTSLACDSPREASAWSVASDRVTVRSISCTTVWDLTALWVLGVWHSGTSKRNVGVSWAPVDALVVVVGGILTSTLERAAIFPFLLGGSTGLCTRM